MKTKLKSILAASLCAVGFSVWAEPTPIPGSSLFYELTEDLTVLTISGTGAMPDDYSAPWSMAQDYIKTVKIESGVTYIGNRVFIALGELTSVTIPSSVTSIGTGLATVFMNDKLAELHIQDVASWCKVVFSCDKAHPFCESRDKLTTKLFVDGEEMTELDIPSTATQIGQYAFYGCNGLTSVTIPSSVTSIGLGAFGGCTSLKSVTIPSSVTKIESYVFSETSLTSVTIPSSVTSIGGYAFNSPALKSAFVMREEPPIANPK